MTMSTDALTKLLAAVKADDRAQVEAILKAGGDVNTVALDERSALHVAAESDSVAVAKLLLAKGAVISAEIKGGWRALHVAASKNNSRVAKLLASKGASLNAADELGRLPLHIAVQNKSINTIKVLIASGASLETALKGGWRPLHIAANKNYGGVAKILLAAGATVDCPDEGGWTPLHVAASRNSTAVVKQLLAKGASVESESENGWMPLHAAANKNSVDVAKVLISKGAVASATTKNGQTALHLAAQKNHIAMAELLISRGISVEAKDKRGTTPLHFAAENNSVAVVELLLSRGANPKALDKIADTPLHRAAMGNSVAVIELLVRKYSSVDLLNKYGQTPLHFSAQRVALEAGRLLIQKEANILALDQNGRHPLMALVLGDSKKSESNEDRLNFAHFLLTYGATWSESDHETAKQAAAKRCESGRQSSSLLITSVIAAVRGWMKQRELGVQNLTALPIEVFERGELDIQAFFSSISSFESTSSGGSDQVPSVTYRKKLCVVGPSKWGKTSLIKSLITQRPSLEDDDIRTMGIDLFPWTFEFGRETRDRYSVTIWDFAGQDEYRSAHSLFYSKRTTYLVCINLRAYKEALESEGIRNEPGKYSAQMDNFVRHNVYLWIRAISARQPESEFVFVGTMVDQIGKDASIIKTIEADVMARIKREEDMTKQSIEREIRAFEQEVDECGENTSAKAIDDHIQKLRGLLNLRPRILCKELVVTSSADISGMEAVRRQLQDLIVSSGTAFTLPVQYMKLSTFVQDSVNLALTSDVVGSQVTASFVSIDDAHRLIQSSEDFAQLSESEISAALHTLHDLGDVLWFDDESDHLSKIIFLSPHMVIEFIRQVINHTLGDPQLSSTLSPRMRELHTAVREDGRVPHDLISRLELWRDVRSDRLMLQLKQLLYHFQLGYPAGGGDLEWDSDVMVPIYWRKCVTSEAAPQGKAEIDATLPHRIRWEYDFHSFLPEELFEKFCVVSYSSRFSTDRVFTRDSFESIVEGIYTARVRRFCDELDGANVMPNILAIEIHAASEEGAWQQLIWYIFTLEKVLDSYRGLWITRYAVTRLGRRFPVDKLILEQRDTASLARTTGFSPTSHSAYKTLLPPNMEWFTQKKWRKQANCQEVDQVNQGNEGVNCTEMSHRLSLMEMRMVAELSGVIQSTAQNVTVHIEGKIDSASRAVVNVVASTGNRMDYPALWTLEHHNGHQRMTSTFELRIRSQLSGKCFHDPIQITVGSEIFGKYGVHIQTGLSLFASVIPDMLGKNAIDTIISACSTQLDRAVHVHGLVDGLDLPDGGYHDMEKIRTLSPDETVALLRDLLTVYDPAFDIKRMSKISKLECGIVHESGDCIWAHRDEILERSATMRFRHDYTKGPFESRGSPLKADATREPHPVISKETDDLCTSDAEKMKNGLSPPEEDQEVKCATLRILGVENMRKVPVLGKYGPYCKWKLINSDNQEISSGRTSNNSSSPNWSNQSYTIDLRTLKGSKLSVVVKTPRLFGRMSTTIATGSFLFQDDLKPDQSQELCAPLTRDNSPAGELRFTMHTSNS